MAQSMGLMLKKTISISGRLDYINAGIPGYGVPESLIGKRRPSPEESLNEGIWLTNLASGRSEMLLSINDIIKQIPEQEAFVNGTYYVFNVKINPQGTRGFAVIFVRNIPRRSGWALQLVTFDIDGTNVNLAVPDRLWRRGGHHPSWMPDGNHILMNLKSEKGAMKFVKFRFDGKGLTSVAPTHLGGGHPSVSQDMRNLLTDAYVSEPFIDANGCVPIRLIDLEAGEDKPLCKVFTAKLSGPRRIDPHPAWSQGGSKVCFNGLVDGMRQVMIADIANRTA